MVTTEGVESGFAPINSSLMYGRSKSPRFALMRVHFSLKQLTLSIYLTIISKIRLSLVCLCPQVIAVARGVYLPLRTCSSPTHVSLFLKYLMLLS